MSLELLFAILAYAFVTSVTPGPNNTILLASGANFGFRATVPALLGVIIGFTVMLLAVALGLGSIFTLFPVLHEILRYLGAAYLLFLAWKIATAKPGAHEEATARPPGFLQMAGFQWVNPKAWIVALGAVATYLPVGSLVISAVLFVSVYAIGALPWAAAWAGFGTLLRGVLANPTARRVFNGVMALLLVASLVPILFAL